jgi:tetraacyldisaccharide 4'-kinase
MLSRCELYFLEVIKNKRRGMRASLLKGLLRLLSWPYRLIVSLRNLGFDAGLFKQYHPPIPIVISVGNIVAGGSGKTPTTLMLAKEFYDNSSIGIVTRGYRSIAEKLPLSITLCAGKGPQHSAVYCGDEPFMLAENLPKAFIFVGKDRRQSINLATTAGVNIVFLDDGMQHRQIGRDIEVIVMDVEDPFGQGFFFPRGLLRENPKSLARADLIVLNYINSSEHYQTVKSKVRKYSDAPVVGAKLCIDKMYDLQGQEIHSLKEKRVAVFCGLARPERFLNTIHEMGAKVVAHQFFPDHHHFRSEQIRQLGAKYKECGAEMLVCTEKDKVKLTELSAHQLPITWLKMGLQIIEGRTEWEVFVNMLKKDLAKKT